MIHRILQEAYLNEKYLKDKSEVPELTEEEKKTTFEYRHGDVVRRTKFKNEEEKKEYERWQKKSRYYMRYFFLGIGLNFLFYYLGMTYWPEVIYPIATNVNLGFVVGLMVPMAIMFAGAELHYRAKEKKISVSS